MNALRNVTTSDGYTDAATLHCPGASVINLSVRNAAVLVQLGDGSKPPMAWQEEFFVPPIDRSMPRRPGRPIDGIRVKSAAAGVPAQVSVDAG